MPNEPSLWDLKSLIERNHTDAREDILDLKDQMARSAEQNDEKFRLYLLREVFDAKETAMLQRITALEEAAKAARAQVRMAVYASAGSIVAAVLTGIILAVILKGGGKA